ncbi:MAG TPA: polyprenyl synthetase family protein [Actinomycetota bacterium]
MRVADVPLPAACLDLAAAVEEDLARFLQGERAEAEERAPGVGELFDELERVIAAGGKRLRPVFCLLGHRAAGGEVGPVVIRAAASLELLHTFAIVHDDVMDGSRTRRGAPATWAHLEGLHAAERMRGSAEVFGVSGAILAGDLALILADGAFLGAGLAPGALLPALARYNRMRVEVVAGQYLDVAAAHRGEAAEPEARRIAGLKSGNYTVEGPLQIGAILAGGSGELLAALSRYGMPLGEAFQLRDDILGVFGDPALTGKPRDSDLREGKRTVLIARALERAEHEEAAFLLERLGAPDLTDADVERIRGIIESSGALDAVGGLVAELADRARAALDVAGLPGDVRAALADLVETCTLRIS